jgi:hypothetical protein
MEMKIFWVKFGSRSDPLLGREWPNLEIGSLALYKVIFWLTYFFNCFSPRVPHRDESPSRLIWGHLVELLFSSFLLERLIFTLSLSEANLDAIAQHFLDSSDYLDVWVNLLLISWPNNLWDSNRCSLSVRLLILVIQTPFILVIGLQQRLKCSHGRVRLIFNTEIVMILHVKDLLLFC